MEFLTTLAVIFSLIFSWASPLLTLNIAINNRVGKEEEIVVENPETTDINSIIDTSTISENDISSSGGVLKPKNFVPLDLYGYCTIDMPQSHFSIDENTTETTKIITYKDNKTRLTMSYVTNIASDTDIPGFIARQEAGVDTTTNNRVEETYNNKTWTKITADKREDGNNVYVWYILDESKETAFWVKAKVNPDAETEEFYNTLKYIFESYKTYYIGNTVFDTPDTGYYENFNPGDSTEADTSNYKSNTKANTVFQDRGGYIANADISADWKDMEIIIDGNKFKLPSTLGDFYEAGFEINQRDVNSTTTIYRGRNLPVSFINSKGTVIKLTLLNESDVVDKLLDECTVVELLIDSSEFISLEQKDVAKADGTNSELDKYNNDVSQEEIDLILKYGDSIPQEELDKLKKKENQDNKEEADLENTEEETIEEENTSDENLEETIEIESEISNEETNTDIKELPKGITQDELNNYEHELILAGGVTWGVYLDDLIAYYGNNCNKVRSSDSSYNCTYTFENKTMTINVGRLKGINYVKLSCIK